MKKRFVVSKIDCSQEEVSYVYLTLTDTSSFFPLLEGNGDFPKIHLA